jgi:hypothetical protein
MNWRKKLPLLPHDLAGQVMADWSAEDWKRFIEERGRAGEGLVPPSDDIVIEGDAQQVLYRYSAALAHEIGHMMVASEWRHDGGRFAPPRHAEYIGAFLIKAELRDDMIGCRTEVFARDVERFGRTKAVWLYRWDTLVSLRAPLWMLIKRAAGLTALADLYKRFTGG